MESNLLTLANLLTACFGMFVCACRMGKMTRHTKPIIRWQYVIWFTGLAASAIGWTYADTTTLPQFVPTLAIVIHLSAGFAVWRHGVPYYALK